MLILVILNLSCGGDKYVASWKITNNPGPQAVIMSVSGLIQINICAVQAQQQKCSITIEGDEI